MGFDKSDYKVVEENLETFLSLVHEECGRPLPDFVEKEFREYLMCGIPTPRSLNDH